MVLLLSERKDANMLVGLILIVGSFKIRSKHWRFILSLNRLNKDCAFKLPPREEVKYVTIAFQQIAISRTLLLRGAWIDPTLSIVGS